MSYEPDRFDYVLTDLDTGEEHGFLIDWTMDAESPFQITTQDQEPPDSMAGVNDELYSYRDLLDTWRMFFSEHDGGQGQETRDNEDAALNRFWSSRNIDISKKGRLKLAPAVTDVEIATGTGATAENLALVAFGGVCFVQYGSLAAPRFGILYEGTCYYSSALTENDDPMTALAYDGEYLYASMAGTSYWGIWRAKFDTDTLTWGTPAKWSTISGVSAMQFCGGYCYVVSGKTPGYVKSDGTLQALDVAAINKPDVETFGLTEIGNWVYWGVTSGTGVWVYALQHNLAEGDQFELYAELPSGFIGTCLEGVAGSLMIGGYKSSDKDDCGQGIVYIATTNGVARLTDIGEDPSLLPSGASTVGYDHRIIGMTAYHDWLYILTATDLYRWDLNDGGLSHWMEIDSYIGENLYSPVQQLGSTQWDSDYAYESDWPADWFTNPAWGPAATDAVTWRRSTADFDYEITTGGNLKYEPETGDLYGGRRWVLYQNDPVTVPDESTIQLKTTTIRYEALEFGLKAGSNMVACVHVRGRTSDDKFVVWIRKADGEWLASAPLEDRNAEHTFYLTNDGTVGNLWIDGVRVFEDVALYYDYSAAVVWWSAGWGFYSDLENKYDWYLTLVGTQVDLTSALPPDYVEPSGTMTTRRSFAVLYDKPYIPVSYATQSGTSEASSFITIDRDSYVTEGELVTSWASSRMPTVIKTFSGLSVHHERLASGQSMIVQYEIDTTMSGQMSVTETDENFSSAIINETGRRARLRFILRSTSGVGTPELLAASLRWSAAPKQLVMLQSLIKEGVRDYYNAPYEPAQAYGFLVSASESQEVVRYRMFGQEGYARVTGLQFSKALPSTRHLDIPQGTALVRLTRVWE